MDANTMATAWMIIWFIIAIAIITHLGLNAYRESKRKRIKTEKKLEEQQKEFNKFTQQENEIHEKMEEEDLEILDLLFGYKDNDIIFNLDSLINYLNDKEIRAFIETLYPVDSNGSNIKLTINFSATRYTVFIKVYNSNTKTVKITEVLRNLK